MIKAAVIRTGYELAVLESSATAYPHATESYQFCTVPVLHWQVIGTRSLARVVTDCNDHHSCQFQRLLCVVGIRED
jgi:hypothetical protein